MNKSPPLEALIEERRQKLEAIIANKESFPHSFERSHKAATLQQEYVEKDKLQLQKAEIQVALAGRIMAKRGPFMVLQDSSGQIQLYLEKKVQKDIQARWGKWDIGDIVGVSGTLQRSDKGDLYVFLTAYSILTKSLRPLPEKYSGLTNTEVRYRQRYVDLIVNKSVREVFVWRSRIIQFMRDYFNRHEFMEVETPMLHLIQGGATAQPFITHHNALDLPMYLRIAPELYLKRLVVGGFERVYEINRNFRNENLSTRHNPEFTMLEFYQAYSNYEAMMSLTEDLLRQLCLLVHGEAKLQYQGQEIDFSGAFKRLTLIDAILHYNPHLNPDDLTEEESCKQILKGLGHSWEAHWGLGRLQVRLFEKTVEHQLQQPTFITLYPTEASPLARRHPHQAELTERFEFFVAGREIANGFSELNDAADQAQRFKEQVADKDAGDVEAMQYDADYIRALEYGLPPTAGEGIGIDRLVMLLTDCASIRDVLLFPTMKPKIEQ